MRTWSLFWKSLYGWVYVCCRGQIIILSHYQKLFDIPLFPGVLLLAPAPLVMVFLASMIVSRSKFFQHSFGALVGLVLVSGYLDWVSNYWLFVIMSWVCFFVLLSIKKTTSRPLPWLEVYEWPFEDEDSENDNSRLNDEADPEQEPRMKCLLQSDRLFK